LSSLKNFCILTVIIAKKEAFSVSKTCMVDDVPEKKAGYLPAEILWYIHIMREFIVYQDDDGSWVAECKELSGYRATGKTKEEVLQKVKHALLIYYPCRCEE
jgi:hypothetical protein